MSAAITRRMFVTGAATATAAGIACNTFATTPSKADSADAYADMP